MMVHCGDTVTVRPADCRQRHEVEERLRVPTAAASSDCGVERTTRTSNPFCSYSSSCTCDCWRHRAANCQRRSSRDRRTMTSAASNVVVVVVVVLLSLLHPTSGSSSTAPVFDTFTSQHLRTFYGNRFSPDYVPYFFTVYVDPANSSQIFVGGVDYVYKLNAEDIQSPYQISENLTAHPNYVSSQSSCMQIGSLVNKAVQCRNHVRTIYRIVNSNEFYICSTGANNPQEFYLSENLQVTSVQSTTSGLNKCPFDPLSDYVYTYVAQGNPYNLPALYTAVAVNNNPKSVTIIRPAIFANRFAPFPAVSLIKTDPDLLKWLNTDDPVYVVGVFDVGPYVYYFFRELALESTQYCSRTYYSRIARVCKIDEGGTESMNLRFTSFLKTRLVCSVTSSSQSSSIPYQFNEIYDVKFDQDSQTFYALFKTNSDSQWGSAVCHYLLTSIDSVFNNSLFLEQSSSNSAWQPVLSGNLAPDPRPGQCSNNTKFFQATTYAFIRSHVLMADAISPPGSGRPLYYSRDLAFEKFAIDILAPNNTPVLYMYRQDAGELHRVALYSLASIPQQRTISIWKPFANASMPLSARSVMFHRPVSNKWLYISTDVALTQLSPEQCDRYTLCTDCVHDPYCGWSDVTHSCLAYEPSLLQNILEEDAVSTCAASCKQTYNRSATVPGMAIHLNCSSYCSSDADVQWWFRPNRTSDAVLLAIDGNSNYIQSKDNGLTILMVNGTEHDGSFECRSIGGQVLTQHDVSMSVCEFGNNVREVWIREYSKWCKWFTTYDSEYTSWKCMKDRCVEQNCIPNVTKCTVS